MRENLLKETLQFIEDEKLNVSDIIFIGDRNSGHSCNWDDFAVMADKYYDSGYGGAEVVCTLEIAFKCGAVMTRGEYDGSEWWKVSRPFKMPETTKPIKGLFYSFDEAYDS